MKSYHYVGPKELLELTKTVSKGDKILSSEDVISWFKNSGQLLEKTGIEYPESFTQDFLFRYCENCELLNIIKEDWFVCVQCDNDLSKTWNIDRKKE